MVKIIKVNHLKSLDAVLKIYTNGEPSGKGIKGMITFDFRKLPLTVKIVMVICKRNSIHYLQSSRGENGM